MNEYRPILSAAKMYAKDRSFQRYEVYADIPGGSLWRGRQGGVGFWQFSTNMSQYLENGAF